MNDTNPYQPPLADLETGDGRKPERAGPWLWLGAIASYLIYAGTHAYVSFRVRQPGLPELLGILIGAAILPLLAVAMSSISKQNRNQRRRVEVFFLTTVVLASLSLALLVAARFG